MNEARYELKNYNQWKTTIKQLHEAKEELYNTKHSTSIICNNDTKRVINHFNHIIHQIEQYDELIKEYCFFINRLERAIKLLLNEEQKEICMIYANYPNNANKREFEALERGYTRSTYYNILNKAVHTLNGFLCALDRLDI